MNVDGTTLETSKGRYALVCVEIDLNTLLTSAINVLGSLHRMEYGGLHLICFVCDRYGHRQGMIVHRELHNLLLYNNLDPSRLRRILRSDHGFSNRTTATIKFKNKGCHILGDCHHHISLVRKS